MGAGESRADLAPEAYAMVFHASGEAPIAPIIDFSRHPYDGIPTTQGGRASGAYGYLGTTWASYRERYAIPDFTPPSQDFAACADLCEHGAVPAIEAGDLPTAIRLLRQEWVSLPNLLPRAAAIFTQYGGIVGATAAPVPIPAIPSSPAPSEAPMGVLALPFLQAILPQVIGLFSGRAQEQISKATGASPDAAAAFFQNLMAQVAAKAGIPIPDDPAQAKTAAIQAVAEVTKPENAPQVAELEQGSVEYLNHLLPVLDRLADYEKAAWQAEEASRDAAAARGRADVMDLAPMLAVSAVALVALTLLALAAIMGIQAWFLPNHEPTTALLTLVGPLLGVVFTGAFAVVYSYRFGSSRSSAAKDVVLGEIAKAK